jgi:hypothetical protein
VSFFTVWTSLHQGHLKVSPALNSAATSSRDQPQRTQYHFNPVNLKCDSPQ